MGPDDETATDVRDAAPAGPIAPDPRAPESTEQAAPVAAPAPRAPRPRPRRPPEPFAVKARRALAARENRRTVLLSTLGFLVIVAFGVYASIEGKADQVEAVVQFTPTATAAQKDAVRRECPTVGKALQEAADHSNLQTVRTYPLRYDVTEASPADKAAIYRCVQAQPGVVGISEYRQGD